MTSTTDYRDILRRWWGYADFRGIQLDIIRSIGAGRDTLGLMPTGGGKSLTFQVPALAMEGTCLVVTPLVALMKDQVAHLHRRSIKATAIHNGLPREEIIARLENCIYGGVKFLYVSPERLGSDLFQAKLRHMHICFITVDEAHCISQWGYDFRPAYLDIVGLRRLLPGTPVLALTATATPAVVDDIQDRLGFAEKNVFRMSFERANLVYVVRQAEDKSAAMLHILNAVAGSAIVYTRSRRDTHDTARWLRQQGISALDYHAGLTSIDKDLRQRAWQEGEARVMVATNAFGMGIDKADVRLVIHTDPPDSVEAYFQEAGRAGRDGQTAYAVLLTHRGDVRRLRRRVADAYPPKDFVRRVYDELAYYFQLAVGAGRGVTYEFNVDTFCRNFHHNAVQVVSALQLLSRAGYIDYRDEDDSTSRVYFFTTRDELYALPSPRPEDEAVLSALLRTYGGLFSDYVAIEEKRLALAAGLTPQQVYDTLKRLTHRRVLHYIPRRRIPRVAYLRDRIDGDRVVLSPEVYECRREQYVDRIEAMLRYMSDDRHCRSRQLLAYFGETDAAACRRCDVCRRRHPSHLAEGDFEALADALRRLVADGQPHRADEIDFCGLPEAAVKAAFSYMVNENLIRITPEGFVEVSEALDK